MSVLLEVLIREGILSFDQLLELSEEEINQDDLGRHLVEKGLISEAQLAKAHAARHGAEYVELTDYQPEGGALSMLPAAVARRHTVMPLAIRDGRLVLAMVDPSNVLAIDDVTTATGLQVTPVVASLPDIQGQLNRHYRADAELGSLTIALEEEAADQNVDVVDTGEDDAPIVRFVNLLVSQGIADRASDIHIEPTEKDLQVRYRIDGVLHEMQRAPKNIQNGVISRLKIMSDIDIAERRKPQDGRMSVTHGGRKIDLRVATLPTVWGEKVVMRILDTSSTSLNLKDLALLEDNYYRFQQSYVKPYGMILVTGPTGSGKSTTLYTTLNTVARPEINVITVEDPVEYRMPGINQVQVNPKAGLTFASALRSILRSDPDVVLLGEIRDHETAQIAVEAALTGHLVLSTLHTNDAPSAVTRLTEMGIEPFLVGSALDCVVAQRLARRLCSKCKTTYQPDAAELAALGLPNEGQIFYKAVGCSACANTGYRGRVAVHEVMSVTEEIERLAVARASSSEISAMARSQGMHTLREDGFAKVELGLTSVEEVLRVVA